MQTKNTNTTKAPLAFATGLTPDEIYEMNKTTKALKEALREAENCLRWAAQEANGRVKREIVGGWLHHADKARAAIVKATGGAL
jgi:hypothetical protein